MTIRALFIDLAGVIIDTSVMPAQWQRLIGEFLGPRLGGDADAWKAANVYAAERMWARLRDPGGTPREVQGRLRRLWLREMCEHVGVPVPRNAGAVAEETVRWVTERVVAPMPGAVDALRALHRAGYSLYTSTGNPSVDTDGYLRALGVRQLFERTYGIDVVDRWKTSSAFYRAILADSGVDGRDAATVDDSEQRLDWARKAGFARTFLVAPRGTPCAHEVIASLMELTERLS